MTATTTVNDRLERLLQSRLQSWLEQDESRIDAVHRIEERPAEALVNILEAELSGRPTYQLLADRFDDLHQFDFATTELLGSMLQEIDAQRISTDLNHDKVSVDLSSSLFADRITAADIDRTASVLRKDGYCAPAVTLSQEQLDKVFHAIEPFAFAPKGTEAKPMSGKDLQACCRSSAGAPDLQHGDTFWLTDQNGLVREEFMRELAFDPFITAVARSYFGCAPCHVQTNVWFSFPTGKWTNNLSSNAQMYHQDKEFVKFLKVFIYLTDVDETKGPHNYVEGSHHDELHRKGQAISSRVSDQDIRKYYDPSRIRSVTGPAGLIMFGDTSCVHKGTPVLSGHRAILQLEYAASLYLSPVAPFDDLTPQDIEKLQYPAVGRNRLLANYSTEDRRAFLQLENSRAGAKPPSGVLSTARKIKRKIQHLFYRQLA